MSKCQYKVDIQVPVLKWYRSNQSGDLF